MEPNKFTKNEGRLFANLLSTNPLFVAQMLKIELSEKYKEKYKKYTFEKQMKKYNYSFKGLNNWWKSNILSKSYGEDLSKTLNETPIISILALQHTQLEFSKKQKQEYAGKILEIQALKGNNCAIELLLNLWTNFNIIQKYGNSAFINAVNQRHKETVQTLLKFGVNPDCNT